MQFNKVIFGILFIFLGSCSEKVSTTIEPKILPQPSSLELKQDNFILNNKLKIFSTPDFQPVSKYFIDFLKEQYSFDLISTDSKDNCDICFLIQESLENEESYTLEVTKENVVINAATPQGSFYATQTLKQLLPLEITEGESYAIQGLTITDTPQFGYRGMHLDVGRHFYSVDFIKKYIDLIALMKMNTFHWHLTEDQGWRIEIKKYPRLTSHAAFRNETLIGHYSDQPHQFDGKRYGGFYTQEQIKELVAYASERFVTIIPEIEMPGHSQAAISAYPELGCTGEAVEVASKWGVFEEVYCPHEKTFAFLEDVIDEVVELFPGKYIHIGGDEAPKTRWKNCNSCQQLIKEQGLKDEHELQSYFISRMEKYINSKGKQIIGWDEILEGGLAPNATVMSWRGMDGAIQAAKEHHEVIMTP
ncbi:MAG: beta-N-acetylhexosaminidase, partial [Flavobacteriaceae bacterium]|nr:beta-N-acetylhexosaminidase [Flavobacteriaceae bacterium]